MASSSPFLERIRRLWAALDPAPPVPAEFHPRSADGKWISLSLSAPDAACLWLHFRQSQRGVQQAITDDFPDDAFAWYDAPGDEGILAAMQAFVETFEESRGTTGGLESPPCSMPPLD